MKRFLLTGMMVIMGLSYAKSEDNTFTYSARDWRKIANNSPEEFFKTAEAKEYAENVLLYQRNVGGWPKNMPMHKPLSKEEVDLLISQKDIDSDCTTDNNATISEMKYLSGMYKETRDRRYKTAFNNGMRYILSGQYDNGGWPQFWPNPKGYQVHITFNDDSMMNIMKLLDEYSKDKSEYSHIREKELITVSRKAHEKGLKAILKCQYVKNGRKTIWPQQCDKNNYQPEKARSYELPSLSPQESTKIIKHLMSVKNPSEEIKQSVVSAMEWLEEYKLTGIRFEWFRDKYEEYDRHVVADPDAEPLWARYYDLDTDKPYFCGRDGVKKNSVAEIERERRVGYGWYTDQPRELFETYAEWKKEHIK